MTDQKYPYAVPAGSCIYGAPRNTLSASQLNYLKHKRIVGLVIRDSARLNRMFSSSKEGLVDYTQLTNFEKYKVVKIRLEEVRRSLYGKN